MPERALQFMLNRSRFLRYHRYPHYHWARTITELLANVIGSEGTMIIDAPCGDGAISYWLIRSNIGKAYELVDISPRAIEIAKRMHILATAKDVELRINCKDIFDMECHDRDDIWLLINSLYLLPDVDRLLTQIRHRSKYVIGIFPYIDRRNYRCYRRLRPGRNINEMSEYETIQLFNKHGYELEFKHDVTYIPFICLTSSLDYLPSRLAQRLVLLLLNPIDRFVPHRAGFYWVGEFRRAQIGTV